MCFGATTTETHGGIFIPKIERGIIVEYFKHDINASEDDKICELLANEGYELLGYYWRFIEYLYSRGGKVYKDKLNGVAWSLHMDVEKLSRMICEYGLFFEDGEFIYSRRVVAEIEEFEAVGKRMSEIGKAGGQASAQARVKRAVKKSQADGQAEVDFFEADGQQNKKEEKKIKENKKKENKRDERMNEIEPCETHDRSSVQCEDVFTSDNEMKKIGGLGKGVVFLSDAQMEDLLDKMSLDEFDKYIGIIAENELSGKHYLKKTHYRAILDMVAHDRQLKK